MTYCWDYDDGVDEETVQNEWSNFFDEITEEELADLRERYRQLKEKLSEDQKKYKREVEQRANIKHYKM